METGTSRTCPRLVCSRETGLLKSVKAQRGNKVKKIDSYLYVDSADGEAGSPQTFSRLTQNGANAGTMLPWQPDTLFELFLLIFVFLNSYFFIGYFEKQ